MWGSTLTPDSNPKTLAIMRMVLEWNRNSKYCWNKETRGPWSFTPCLSTYMVIDASHWCSIIRIWNIALNDPKQQRPPEDQTYPIHVLRVPHIPKFHSFLLYDNVRVTGQFEAKYIECQQDAVFTRWPRVPYICSYGISESQVSLMIAKWHWILRGQRCRTLFYQCYRVSNFNMPCSTTSHFGVTSHFVTSAPKDPKMLLSTRGLNVFRICPTDVTGTKFPIRLSL